MLSYRSDDYYYDELYPRENEYGSFEDYENGQLNAGEDEFGQLQNRESHEKYNFMNQDTKHRVQVTESGNLVLRHVTRQDKGSYVCRATNMVGSKSSEAATLSVHGKN